jgi:drug/metabolite transporter (DMT)-like permease
MMFYNTLPLYGALLGHFLLREPLGLAHLIGGALILGAGFVGRRLPAGKGPPLRAKRQNGLCFMRAHRFVPGIRVH